MKRGRNLGKVSIKVLKIALQTGDVFLDKFADLVLAEEKIFGGSVLKSVYNLGDRGYLSLEKKNNQSFFHLTPKGKLTILKYLHLERIQPRKWDRHWRIVIFDIPESLKKWREYLRRELKNLGFLVLQESVYITPCPVTGELDQILKEWNLRKYFRYITVSEIDGERQLKKEFGLK